MKEEQPGVVSLSGEREVLDQGRMVDYWELTKPRLTFLVLVTTFVGFCMGSKRGLDVVLLFHTVFGTALLAGGAACLNQFLEKDFDAKMKRTRERPIPSGRLHPERAMIFGAILSIIGLGYLVLLVNLLTGFLGAITLSSYLFAYTPLKRKTSYCTWVGAIPGAIPPVMGWTAASDAVGPGAWILFGILFFWQMPHFYALAQIYSEDYARGGFLMLSVVDPTGMRLSWEIVTHTMALLPISLAPTLFGMTGLVYFWSSLFCGLCFLGFALKAAVTRSHSSCRMLFFASILYLPIILVLMVGNKLSS